MDWKWDMREKGCEAICKGLDESNWKIELPLFIALGQIAGRVDLQREVMSLVLECNMFRQANGNGVSRWSI